MDATNAEQPNANNETVTQVTPPSDLPEDPQASFKPPPHNEQVGFEALSHLSGIQFRMEYSDEREAGSVDSVSVSYIPDSYIPDAPDQPKNPGEEFAFVLGRVIGHGGMGEVREAKQISLGRTVAVKRPKPRVQSSEKTAADMELFAREAAVTARLEHPHIIPVHDLGVGPDGLPLLAMKLVRGTPWSEMLKKDKDLSPRERLTKNLPILIDVAQAVAFAHERGVIHRDLKPSQVMVGRHGEVYLMDWGIAVSFDSDDGAGGSSFGETALAATRADHAPNPAGTSAYMAPEQTEITTARLGPWTDVWLLGATLYEILTRRPPYPYPRSAEAFMAACRGVVETPEARIAKRQTGESNDVPPEISKLCMECLQPEIGKRLPSADELVHRLLDYQTGATRREESRGITATAVTQLEDLERRAPFEDTYDDLEACDRILSRAIALDPENIEAADAKQRTLALLAEEAIQAGDLHRARVQAGRVLAQERRNELLKRIESGVRQARRVRRQRVAALALCAVLIAAVAVIALISRGHIARALHRAEASEAAAISAREQLRKTRDEAVHDLYVSNIRLAQREIDDEYFARAEQALLEAPAEHRGWEWRYLMAAAHPELMTYTGHQGPVQSVAFSPNEEFLASASRDGTARIWQVHSGREVRLLEGHKGPLRRISWSADGKQIATAAADRTAMVWDAVSGKQVMALQPHDGAVEDVRFVPARGEIITLASDAHLRCFDASNGLLKRNIDLNSDRAFAFDVSADGKLAAIGAGPNGAMLVSLDTGTTLAALAPEAAECSGVRFSPDGKRVAVAITGSRSYICSVPDGAPIATFSDSSQSQSAKERADGWAVDIVWSKDGSGLYAGMRARPGSRAFRWSDADPATQQFRSVQPASYPTGSDVCSIDLTPNGNYLAVGSETGTICLYDQKAGDGQTTRPVFASENSIHGLRWSPDGSELIASEFTQKRRYNLLPKSRVVTLDVPLPDRSHCVAYSPDGSRVAFTGRRSGFVVQSALTGADIFSIPLEPASDDAACVVFSPDSKLLVTVCCSYPQPRSPVADCWSAVDGRHLKRLPTVSGSPNVAVFSPDGKRLVIGHVGGLLECLSTDDWKQLWKVDAIEGRINAVHFSRDGKRIAAAGAVGGAAVLEASTGKHLTVLSEYGSEFTDIAFSPDGQRLITAAHDAAVGIWDPASGRALCYLKGHSGRLWQAQWSPDGARIASSCSGYPGVQLWEPMQLNLPAAEVHLANWNEELRRWQMKQFQQRRLEADLEKLPQQYWLLSRIAETDKKDSGNKPKELFIQAIRELSSRPEIAPELKSKLDAAATALGTAPVDAIKETWSGLQEPIEKTYLNGRTRGEAEQYWQSRFS